MSGQRLGRAVLELTTDNTAYDAGLDKARQKLGGLETDTKKAGDNIGVSWGKVGGAIAGAVSVTAITGAISKAAEYAGSINDLATKAGITAEAVQELKFAAEQNGGTFDQLSGAIAQMSNRLVEGDKSAVGSLEKMGLSLDALKAMAPDQAFQAISAGIAGIEDPMMRAKIAMDVFGKSGADLLPTMTADIGALRQEARDAGLVLSNDMVASGDKLGDTLDKLSAVFEPLLVKIIVPMIPAIETLAGWIGSAVEVFTNLPGPVQAVGAALGVVASVVGPIIVTFTGFSGLIATVTGLLPALGAALTIATGPVGLIAAAAIGVYEAWQHWDVITGFVESVWTAVKTFIVDKLIPVLSVGGPLLNPIAGVVTLWKNWDKIAGIAEAVYIGVKTWLVDKFQAIVDSIKGKIDAVTGFFGKMYDTVVGNSIVPDLIRDIGKEFEHLDDKMVKPTQTAAGGVVEALTGMNSKANTLIDAFISNTLGRLGAWGSTVNGIINSALGGGPTAGGLYGTATSGGSSTAVAEKVVTYAFGGIDPFKLLGLGEPGSKFVSPGATTGHNDAENQNAGGGIGSDSSGNLIQGFAIGTPSLDFMGFRRRGQAVTLHGDEAIIPRGGGHQLAREIAAAGGWGGTYNININTLDSRSFDTFLQHGGADRIIRWIPDALKMRGLA